MGKPRKSKKSFDYNKDRRKAWRKSRKLPTIHSERIRNSWDRKKSTAANFRDMGLSVNPNKTLAIPTAKDLFGRKEELEQMVKKKGKKQYVADEMEAEASLPQERRLRLSEPDVAFCISMIEKYGEDYKAMARDEENYYQDTPKQIRRKIRVFRSIPEQYNAYLSSKASDS